jgi:hypothetical protein
MKTIDECACGIARADCDYHAPSVKPRVKAQRKYPFVWRNSQWEPLGLWELPFNGRFLTTDGYIHTYQEGKLIDEEPA